MANEGKANVPEAKADTQTQPVYQEYSNGNKHTHLGTALVYERGSDATGHAIVQEDTNLTIIDIQTAVTIGAGAANDTHLIGIQINVALTGTCVITGFEGSAGTAISITYPAATPAQFIPFHGARNAKGALTVTCSNAGDDNDVQVIWSAIQ